VTTTTRPAASTPRVPASAERSGNDADRWGNRLTIIVPALIAYLPLLLTQPGMVGADTKTYLYLDPAKLLADSPYVWDSQIGLGTVTHQNIGYLFPMGPFYLLMDLLHLPDWVAQRLWIATVIFLAGMGVRYLLRTVGFGRPSGGFVSRQHRQARNAGILVASLAYMLSPYLLDYSARISVILLPWVALPWLIALVAKSLRHGGWFYPALFALVVLAVGGINATALIMVGIAPLLFLLHMVFVDKEATLGEAIGAGVRITVLTGITSLWWVAGLWAEGKYGLPVVRYTETYQAVAGSSNAPEVLRGLGYWFFYGNDKLGPWIESSTDYTSNLAVLALSYALPIAALALASIMRWRYRAYFMALIVFGTLIAVGGHPWDSPSFLGGLFNEFTKTNAGLSLRSLPRAVPLVALGTSVFLGAGLNAVARRIPRYTVPISLVTGALIVLNIPTLWNGTMVAHNLERPEDIPDYETQAAAYNDSQDHQTRVWEIPGIDFASYRWGNTVDPVTPGLIERPYVARELFQWGSPQSAAFLNAYDRRLQEGDAEPSSLVPVARTFAVGNVVLRADVQYERFRTARPRDTWQMLLAADGLGPPVAFTDPTNNQARDPQPMVDEVELNHLQSEADAPSVSSFAVDGTPPIVRSQSAEHPLLVGGDADGLVDAATIGMLSPDQAVFFAASYDNSAHPKASTGDDANFDKVYNSQADLLLSDSNRKRAARWGALRENTGYTERAGETPRTYDPSDQRLEPFPAAGDSSYTVSEQHGGTVTATAYGNPITYTPDDRPANAFDGDPLTAWRVGAIDNPTGERLILDLDQPTTTGTINLTQPLTLVRNRFITKVRLHFDNDASVVDADLGLDSRKVPGQTISFPERSFHHLEIEITGDDVGPRSRYDGISGVGFSEVTIPGVNVSEVIRPPTNLLDRAGTSSIDHRLTLLFSRVRSNPAEPVRTDEETRIVRAVNLPTPRTFSIAGTARLSSYAPDDLTDSLLGLPDASQGGVTATSSAHLPGAIDQRAVSAIDGDPSTAWTSIYDQQVGHWLEYVTPTPITFDHMDLDIVTDGRHSVPTKLRIDADGQAVGTVDIPPLADKAEPGATTHVTVPTPTVTGRQLRFTVEGAREVSSKDWYTDKPIVNPVSIAELGVPGLHANPPAASTGAVFDSGCRSDLLTVDGNPVPMRVFGAAADATSREGLRAEACGSATTLSLSAGDHVFKTGSGQVDGIDLDRLVLASEAGGAAAPVGSTGGPSPQSAPPTVNVTDDGRVSYDASVDRPNQPFWLVVGQSWNPGWTASIGGVSLGAPQVINGYANGWYVDPAQLPAGSGPLAVHVEWAPQRIVWIAIAISIVGLLICMAILFFGRKRRRRPAPARDEPDRPYDSILSRPRLRRALGGEGLPGRTVALATAALTALALLETPKVAWQLALVVPYAVVVAWGLRSPRGRSILGLAGAGCLALAAAYIFVQQARHGYSPDFVWPQLFDRIHILGMLTVFLLAAEAVRELLVLRLGGDRRLPSAGADAVEVMPGAPTADT
jgi:arabinofuranan 3-O-arabinosyltransferase